MLKKYKNTLILSSIVTLLPIIVGLLLWKHLPEQIATHWNANGENDGWSTKSFAIFGLPIIMLAAHWICILSTCLDSKAKEQNSKIIHMVLWIMPITSILVSGFTYSVALGIKLNPTIIMSLILGLTFIILGNYMPKCTPNHSIGVRIRYTLRNNENWNKTHRMAGKLWVAGGILFLMNFFFRIQWLEVIIMFAMILSLVVKFFSNAFGTKV